MTPLCVCACLSFNIQQCFQCTLCRKYEIKYICIKRNTLTSRISKTDLEQTQSRLQCIKINPE